MPNTSMIDAQYIYGDGSGMGCWGDVGGWDAGVVHAAAGGGGGNKDLRA